MPIKEAIIINNLPVPGIKFNQSRIISFSSVQKKRVIYLCNYYQEFGKKKSTGMQELG